MGEYLGEEVIGIFCRVGGIWAAEKETTEFVTDKNCEVSHATLQREMLRGRKVGWD